MRYWKLVLVVLMIVFLLAGCGKREASSGIKNPYLGQKPPGMIPEIFAPGIVSTDKHLEFGCTWSPDGKQFLFTRREGEHSYNTIMTCNWTESGWTKPEAVAISDSFPKMSPRFFPDGQTMVYTAWRPPGQGIVEGSPFSLWITEKKHGRWEIPKFFKSWFSMSVARSGSFYFHDIKGIGILLKEDCGYGEPDILGEEINTGNFDQHPFVSPDERFFLFDSHRPGGYGDADLYVAFNIDNQKKYRVVNLGEKINTFKSEFCPVLSPDGKYLFYTSDEDIFWVDVRKFIKGHQIK